MFSVRHSYQGPLGEVKFSQAASHAHFKNKTQGIALKYVNEGQENYFINGKKLPVSQGQFIILQQGTDYETYTPNKPMLNRGICVDLEPELLHEVHAEIFDSKLLYGLVFSCDNFAGLGKKFKAMEVKEGATPIQEMYTSLIEFSQYLQHIQLALESTIKKSVTQKEIIGKLFFAKNFIHQRYTQTISLEKLGQEAAISPFHLNRLFRRCFGQTPYELQLELKMESARESLHQEISLSQIAFDLGYHDLAAFSRQFKKYWSEPPSAFRKRLL